MQMKSNHIIEISTYISLTLPATVVMLLFLAPIWALRIALLGGPLALSFGVSGLILTLRAGEIVTHKAFFIAAQVVGVLSGTASVWMWWQFLHWGPLG
jgi:hypothetical protein